jgi:hypothetical protein
MKKCVEGAAEAKRLVAIAIKSRYDVVYSLKNVSQYEGVMISP